MKLKLNDDINTDFVRFKGQRRYNRTHPLKLLKSFSLISAFTNTQITKMYVVVLEDKDFCMKECGISVDADIKH